MTTAVEGLTRCVESIRDTYGYSRCHLASGHTELHHVRGRAWTGSWGDGTARLSFAAQCSADCWPEDVQLWGAAPDALIVQRRAARRLRKAPD